MNFAGSFIAQETRYTSICSPRLYYVLLLVWFGTTSWWTELAFQRTCPITIAVVQSPLKKAQ